MINKLFILSCLLMLQIHSLAGKNLPIDTLGSKDASKPLVVYISGDGGLNTFSTQFIKQWNMKGYPIIALNSKTYFWKTKLPDVAAKDITEVIMQYLNLWKRNEVILVGYSLGADIMPFIQNRLSQELLTKVKHSVLLSPSNNTDFTVHLFYSSTGGNSVPVEINKLNKPTLIIFGKEETDIPVKLINNKMVTILTLPGDHHYDNQTATLTDEILKRL